jgi:hypothetical protein
LIRIHTKPHILQAVAKTHTHIYIYIYGV